MRRTGEYRPCEPTVHLRFCEKCGRPFYGFQMLYWLDANLHPHFECLNCSAMPDEERSEREVATPREADPTNPPLATWACDRCRRFFRREALTSYVVEEGRGLLLCDCCATPGDAGRIGGAPWSE